MPLVFLQLGAVLGISVLVSLLMRGLRQPLLVGYIITGIFIGPSLLGLVEHGDVIDTFGQLGVTFLLFILGLSLRPQLIRDVGKVSVITGVGQIIFTSTIGYGIAIALGYPWITALYLGLAFTFSSTVIVMQLLHTQEEQDALYGRIAIGFLLVQDLAAMFIFLFLTSFDPVGGIQETALTILAKLSLIVLSVYVLIRHIVPRIEWYFSKSQEIVFLFSLAVCFLLAAGFRTIGFSQELGALLAGIILSHSPFHRDVALKLAPLRDFFLMMFFVVLGTQVSVAGFLESMTLILAFSGFILIGNPFIVMVLMRWYGYTLRTAFFAGLTVAQISEFSLILLAAGASLGQIPASLIGPATMVGLLTIFVSSYYITHNHRLFVALQPFLRLIFGPDGVTEVPIESRPIDVVLFGCHRLGSGVVDALEEMKVPFLVVEQDPELIRVLRAAEVPFIFGSAEDPALLEAIPLKRVKTIITTIPDADINELLIQRIRAVNSKAVILSVASRQEYAEELYNAGATYVVVPPYLGRRYIVNLLKEYRLAPKGYQEEREAHLRELLFLKDDAA